MAISKFNYNSFNVTPVASKALAFDADADGFTTASGSSMILIKTLTASSSGTLSFVNGSSDVVLDDTYPIYKFEFINIHPSGSGSEFMVGFRDGGTNFDATNTCTIWYAYNFENDGGTAFEYNTSEDNAQVAGFAKITGAAQIGTDNDESASGEMTLFNPSSTTFAKHFLSKIAVSKGGNSAAMSFAAGYFNTTSAIDEIQFKMASGDIDAGQIKLYGIKDS